MGRGGCNLSTKHAGKLSLGISLNGINTGLLPKDIRTTIIESNQKVVNGALHTRE